MEEEKKEEVKVEEKETKKCGCDTTGFWKQSKAFLLIAVIMFLMIASFALGEICGVALRKPDNDEPQKLVQTKEGKYNIKEDDK